MVIRTVLTVPMRASQLAAVSGRGLKEWGGQQVATEFHFAQGETEVMERKCFSSGH